MTKNTLHPKKLHLTKWTAVNVVARQKHFLVSAVIVPEDPAAAIVWVELEAIYSKEKQRIAWRDLQDQRLWLQGWL